MKRALALSITTLLLPIAAVAATSPPPAGTRYSLLHIEAASTPAPANRYRLNGDSSAATAAGRFRLLGAGAAKATAEACASADDLFANGLEN
jgi:hypothetical protein